MNNLLAVLEGGKSWCLGREYDTQSVRTQNDPRAQLIPRDPGVVGVDDTEPWHLLVIPERQVPTHFFQSGWSQHSPWGSPWGITLIRVAGWGLYLFFFGHPVRLVGSWLPNQALNPGPWQ